MEYNLYIQTKEWNKLKLLQRIPKLFDERTSEEFVFNEYTHITSLSMGTAPKELLQETHTILNSLPPDSFNFYIRK